MMTSKLESTPNTGAGRPDQIQKARNVCRVRCRACVSVECKKSPVPHPLDCKISPTIPWNSVASEAEDEDVCWIESPSQGMSDVERCLRKNTSPTVAEDRVRDLGMDDFSKADDSPQALSTIAVPERKTRGSRRCKTRDSLGGTLSGNQSLVSFFSSPTTNVSSIRRKRRRSASEGGSSSHSFNDPAVEEVDNTSEVTSPSWPALRGQRSINMEKSIMSNCKSSAGNSLAEWLRPREPQGKKRTKKAKMKTETWMSDAQGPSSDEERVRASDQSENWMSERLGGLDPNGAARAKDGWVNRERHNLTCTDVALGMKRKPKGGKGWKTCPDGSKVFVAPSRGGGSIVTSGQEAFRLATSSSWR